MLIGVCRCSVGRYKLSIGLEKFDIGCICVCRCSVGFRRRLIGVL